jgi:hypothetical protein
MTIDENWPETAALIERKIEKEKSINLFPKFEVVYPFMVQQYACHKHDHGYAQEFRKELQRWFPDRERYEREMRKVEEYKREVFATRDGQYVFKRPEGESARGLLTYFIEAGQAIDEHAAEAAEAKRLRSEEHI